MAVEIWMNPSCSKCRSAKADLDAAGIEYVERRYLDEPPTVAELAAVLVQIADFDQSAPPYAAAKAAFAAQAEVRHYPGDHFDLFPGRPFHEAAVKHAVRFLTRHLAVAGPFETVAAQPPQGPKAEEVVGG